MLRNFQSVSGLKLNFEKTIAKSIGSVKHSDCIGNFNIKWSDDPVQTLGIIISNDPRVIMEENFMSKLRSTEKILNMWSIRGLSLKGRVTILKSLVIPKFLYPMSVLPVPKNVVDAIDNMIINFVWNKRKPKIKRDVIIQSIKMGGINVPHFASMVETNRILWLKRLLNDTAAKWKRIFGKLIKPFSIKHFVENILDQESINAIQIPFYKQLFEFWTSSKRKPCKKHEIAEQIIWKNRYIQLPGGLRTGKTKGIYWPKLYQAGIVRVKDLFTPQGSPIDLVNFCRENNIAYNFLQVLRVKKAIPPDWLALLSSPDHYPLNVTNSSLNVSLCYKDVSLSVRNSTTKEVYKLFVSKRAVQPTAQIRWNEIFNIEPSDWESIYRLPYSATRETNLQALQYKVLNRIIACKKWLHTQKIIDSPNCSCGELDDLMHFLVKCTGLNGFWKKLERWINCNVKQNTLLTEKHIIFGIYYDLKYFRQVNYILLLAKWHVCNQKYFNHSVDLYTFFPVLKSHLDYIY